MSSNFLLYLYTAFHNLSMVIWDEGVFGIVDIGLLRLDEFIQIIGGFYDNSWIALKTLWKVVALKIRQNIWTEKFAVRYNRHVLYVLVATFKSSTAVRKGRNFQWERPRKAYETCYTFSRSKFINIASKAKGDFEMIFI